MLIDKGEQERASIVVDRRHKKVNGCEDGYFVFPTVLDGVSPQGENSAVKSLGRFSV